MRLHRSSNCQRFSLHLKQGISNKAKAEKACRVRPVILRIGVCALAVLLIGFTALSDSGWLKAYVDNAAHGRGRVAALAAA
jgi:hypothetical protein